MRKHHRVALNRIAYISYALLGIAAVLTLATTVAPSAPQAQETSWTAPLSHPSQPRTELLTAQSLQPLAVYFAAVQSAQLEQFASSVVAAQAASARAAQAERMRTAPFTATTSPPTPSGAAEAPGAIWACIIRHESGGDPRAVNPLSGAGGLYQFMPSTWQANGGAGLPEDASPATQTAMAEKVEAQQGWGPWKGDGCTPVG